MIKGIVNKKIIFNRRPVPNIQRANKDKPRTSEGRTTLFHKHEK